MYLNYFQLNKLEENGLNRADSNLTETKPDQHLSILATAEEVFFHNFFEFN